MAIKSDKIKDKIKNDKNKLKNEVGNQFTKYIMAGFGLVVGLAWNDAIKDLIQYLFPLEQSTLTAKFVYASLLTIIVIIIGFSLSNIFKKDEKKILWKK